MHSLTGTCGSSQSFRVSRRAATHAYRCGNPPAAWTSGVPCNALLPVDRAINGGMVVVGGLENAPKI